MKPERKRQTADGREVVFAFVGAGSVLDKLVLYVKEHQMNNVVFIPYQDKADLIYSLNAGDVHWCVNAKGIKGVSCPSNVYLNKPKQRIIVKKDPIFTLNIPKIRCKMP